MSEGEEEEAEAVVEKAAKVAQGEDEAAADATDTADAASGGEEVEGTSLRDVLTSTEPHKDLDDLDDFSEWSEDWEKYYFRAGLKMTGAKDEMAIMDLIKGTVGAIQFTAEELDI